MKKLVIISVVIALMLSLSIGEIVITNNVFTSIATKCDQIEKLLIDEETADANSEKIETLMSDLEHEWSSFRKWALLFVNSNNVKNFTEKLVSIKRYYVSGSLPDAYAYANVVSHLAREMAKENVPYLSNLLYCSIHRLCFGIFCKKN